MINNYYYYYYYRQSPLSSANSPAGSRCYPCPFGYYANQTGLVQCTYCPAGSYCPIKTSTPIQCPPGSYSDNSTAFSYGDTCLTCPANTYTLSNGSTSCLACPDGKICPDPTRAPIAIPLGILITFHAIFWYILLYIIIKLFDTGFKANSANQIVMCSVGYYSKTVDGVSTCIICPAGSFCPDPSIFNILKFEFHA